MPEESQDPYDFSIRVAGAYVQVPADAAALQNLTEFTLEGLVYPDWDVTALGSYYCVLELAAHVLPATLKNQGLASTPVRRIPPIRTPPTLGKCGWVTEPASSVWKKLSPTRRMIPTIQTRRPNAKRTRSRISLSRTANHRGRHFCISTPLIATWITGLPI